MIPRRQAEARARRLAAAVSLRERLEHLGIRAACDTLSASDLDRSVDLDPEPQRRRRDWLLVADVGSGQEPAGTDAPPRIMVRTVIVHVARTTGIDATLLASEARSRPIAQARHLAMYLARALCGASYAQIGERLGGRDHTTAHHGVHAAMRRFGLPRPEQLPRAVALRLLLDGPPDLAAEHLVQHGR